MFEADIVCYDKTISSSFPIIKRKRLTLMLTQRSSYRLKFFWGLIFAIAQEVFMTEDCFHIHVSCFVGDETEIKEPQNVINYPVKFKYPRLSLHLWPYINFESLYAFKLLDCLSWI